MNEEIPVQSSDESTAPVSDANLPFETMNLDAEFDKMWGDMQDDAVAPLMPTEDDDSMLEVSEEIEQETSEDDSNIDTAAESEVEESEVESTPESVVDWDEMGDHLFEIDGKAYSRNDLKAALGRQRKQDEAHNEVETARQELAAREAALAAREETITHSNNISAGQQSMAQLQLQGQQLKAQLDAAVQANDGNQASLIQARLGQLGQQYQQVEAQVAQAQQQKAAAAAAAMERFGFADLNSDPQLQTAFKEYAFANIPANLVDVVNTNPELLAMVEKARRYDKNTSEAKSKKKLVGSSSKTLKGSAAKAAPKKKAPNYSDKMTAQIDAMFDD